MITLSVEVGEVRPRDKDLERKWARRPKSKHEARLMQKKAALLPDEDALTVGDRSAVVQEGQGRRRRAVRPQTRPRVTSP
jgi:hypothetical protein